MNSEPPIQPVVPAAKKHLALKVFGVGCSGINLLEQVIRRNLANASFVAVNTEAQSLAASSAPDKLHLETKPLRGLGTGGDPERGRAVAEEHLAQLKSLCAGADVVFILAGLGGGAGSGISPVLAQAARESGALVLAFVTMPFDCEGSRRRHLALAGLAALKAAADGVVCLPNQKIVKLIDDETSVVDTFKLANELLAEGIRGIWGLLAHTGLIQLHFEDLCALLRGRHTESAFAAVDAMGPTRSRDVTDKLLAHPLLDGGQALAEADTVLVSLMGGPDLTMAEINRVMEQINSRCAHAQVVMGAGVHELFREHLAVTLVAARKNSDSAEDDAASHEEPEPLDRQLLGDSSAPRPGSRILPPPPTLSVEQAEQILVEHAARRARGRKTGPKMRQGTLPLEIISKGRFDKSEPTIHKGEDLDVPTYIRRGVQLN